MSTGVESFANIDTLGAIYPMPGNEMLLTIIAVVFWAGCIVWRIVTEKQEHEEIMKCVKEMEKK